MVTSSMLKSPKDSKSISSACSNIEMSLGPEAFYGGPAHCLTLHSPPPSAGPPPQTEARGLFCCRLTVLCALVFSVGLITIAATFSSVFIFYIEANSVRTLMTGKGAPTARATAEYLTERHRVLQKKVAQTKQLVIESATSGVTNVSTSQQVFNETIFALWRTWWDDGKKEIEGIFLRFPFPHSSSSAPLHCTLKKDTSNYTKCSIFAMTSTLGHDVKTPVYSYGFSTSSGTDLDVYQLRTNTLSGALEVDFKVPSSKMKNLLEVSLAGNETDSTHLSSMELSDGRVLRYLVYQERISLSVYGLTFDVVGLMNLHDWHDALFSVVGAHMDRIRVAVFENDQIISSSLHSAELCAGDSLYEGNESFCQNQRTSGLTFTDDFASEYREALMVHKDCIVNTLPFQDACVAQLQGVPFLLAVALVNISGLMLKVLYLEGQAAALEHATTDLMTGVVAAAVATLIAGNMVNCFSAVLLYRARQTVALAISFVSHLAQYDLQEAQQVVSLSSASSDIKELFERIINSLESFRPFLPPNLMPSMKGIELRCTDTTGQNEQDVALDPRISISCPSVGEGANASIDAAQYYGEGLSVPMDGVRLRQLRAQSGAVLAVELSGLDTTHAARATKSFNSFLEVVFSSIMKHAGMVDVVSSGIVLGTFNVYTTVLQPESAACSCALQILSAMQEMPNLSVWVSVAARPTIVGTCGDESNKFRLSMGEEVELACCLHSLQRLLDVRVMVTDTIARATRYATIPVDVIRLRRTKPPSAAIRVYELLSQNREEMTEDEHALAAIFRQFQLRDPCEAEKLLLECHNKHAPRLLSVVRAHSRRIAEYGLERAQYFWEPLDSGFWENDEPSTNDEAEARRELNRAKENALTPAVRHSESEEMLFPLIIGPSVEALPETVKDFQQRLWLRSEKVLGKGSFGEVYLAMKENGEFVAMKTLRTSTATDVEYVMRELSALISMSHPYIAAYESCAVTPQHFFIMMELFPGGTLRSLLNNVTRLPCDAVRKYLRQIGEGLRYLHEHGVIHRDIKPDNIMFVADGTCKLVDFGTAMIGGASTTARIHGTRYYMPPEAMQSGWTTAGDVYAFAMTAAEMFGAADRSENSVAQQSERNRIPSIDDIAGLREVQRNEVEALLSILRRCVDPNPKQRPSVQEILQWL